MSRAPSHDAFDLLAPGLQRALWDMRWRDLRPIQRDAILAWHASSSDLLIMAQTAGGKTEAAFLPVLSAIAGEPEGSVRAVYVGPLKALINDQFGRLELLCRHMDLPVHRWHGDVGDASKSHLIESPSGVLLITPESLESLLINRTPRLPALFGGLRAVVLDELHAFLENERGRHLASLLSRVERYVQDGARPRRVGLSATIGDPPAAARYLCPRSPGSVVLIEGAGERKELRLRVHWYGARAQGAPSASPGSRENPHGGQATGLHESRVEPATDGPGRPADEDADPSLHAIAADLLEHMHASTNLVFANAKGRIELLADAANRICRQRGLDDRFHVHHGSLSKAIREDVEREMKDAAPDTAICSSTLEMGIDIGGVRTVGQVGPPWSVASLKQRLGRSGRRDGEARRLRVYITDDRQPGDDGPAAVEKRLPLDLLQTVAVLELMLTDGWVEPPEGSALDVSTLAQQVISVVAETGGVRAEDLHRRLCGPGPFERITPRLLAGVLRSLGSRDVLEQAPGGELILGLEGERIRASREFYAVFQTPREFAVRAGDRVLGRLPMTLIPREGDHLVFAGRRWSIKAVEIGLMEIMVVPASGAKAPMFTGSAGRVHPRVRDKMLGVLAAAGDMPWSPPAYLDTGAAAALREAAASAAADDLARRRIVEPGPKSCVLLTWTGTRVQETLAAALRDAGIVARAREVSVTCEAGADEVRQALHAWLRQAAAGDDGGDGPAPAAPSRAHSAPREVPELALRLARHTEPRIVRKYDDLMDDWVLDESIAADRLDVPGAVGVAGELLSGPSAAS